MRLSTSEFKKIKTNLGILKHMKSIQHHEKTTAHANEEILLKLMSDEV